MGRNKSQRIDGLIETAVASQDNLYINARTSEGDSTLTLDCVLSSLSPDITEQSREIASARYGASLRFNFLDSSRYGRSKESGTNIIWSRIELSKRENSSSGSFEKETIRDHRRVNSYLKKIGATKSKTDSRAFARNALYGIPLFTNAEKTTLKSTTRSIYSPRLSNCSYRFATAVFTSSARAFACSCVNELFDTMLSSFSNNLVFSPTFTTSSRVISDQFTHGSLSMTDLNSFDIRNATLTIQISPRLRISSNLSNCRALFSSRTRSTAGQLTSGSESMRFFSSFGIDTVNVGIISPVVYVQHGVFKHFYGQTELLRGDVLSLQKRMKVVVSHISEEFAGDTNFTGSIEHSFIISDEHGICHDGTCNEDTVETTTSCSYCNTNGFIKKDAIVINRCTFSDIIGSLNSTLIFTCEPCADSSNLDDGSRRNMHDISLLNNGFSNSVESKLLSINLVSLASGRGHNRFDENCAVKSKHQYLFLRMRRINSVESELSILSLNMSVFNSSNENDCLPTLSLPMSIWSSLSTFNNCSIIADSSIVSPNNDYCKTHYINVMFDKHSDVQNTHGVNLWLPA